MNKWEYHEDYNYWDCFLEEINGEKRHKIVVQPLTESYVFRFYLGNNDFPEIKQYIKAKNVEEAIIIATDYVTKYTRNRANYWTKLALQSEACLNDTKGWFNGRKD